MKLYDLDVIMISAGMQMSGETIPSGKSLGGSETCAIQLAEALVRRGHHVTLFCNTDKPHSARDVYYMPIGWVQNGNGSMFPKGFFDYARTTPSDLIIAQRIPNFLGFEFNSKVNLLWQHDLATRTGPSNFHPMLWNIDKIVVPSDFMVKQYQKVHGGPDRLYQVMRNGIDIALIDEALKANGGDAIERDRFRLTYTARPERGLEFLLRDVFPAILAKEPRAQLFLARYEDPATLPLYQQLDEMIKRFGDRVVSLGHLGKSDLYYNHRKSRLYLYPSVFEEISCLSMQEAGACGTPFVGPWRAALPETAGGAHVLLKEDGTPGRPGDPAENGFCNLKPEFVSAFVDETVALMHDDDRWERLSLAARKRAEDWSWDGVVDEWVELAHKKIAERSTEPRRLVKHLIFNSDVIGAKKYVEATGKPALAASVNDYIAKYVPFVNVEDPEERKKALNAFYEERSGGENANWQTAFWADQEQRLQVLLGWMRDAVEHGDLPEDAKVLDYGCAHGGYVRVLSNEFPKMKFVGVDNAPSLIRCANQLREAKLPDGTPAFRNPENATFVVGDEDGHYLVTDGRPMPISEAEAEARAFDLVVCMEVLEHLPHAEEVAGKLEKLCKEDGWMIFTVPFGHRERDEYATKGVPPVHVRAFDLHDLRDLFGKKKSYGVVSFTDYAELALDKTMPGWFMTFYQNDRKGPGQIDWDRHFFMQGPRETLAVCMMTHNNEDVLHRSLRSTRLLADQIIVVDNGPSFDRSADVAREYTADVRAGTSPFWCYAHAVQHAPGEIMPGTCQMAGFETPRNESIDGVWTDWILWIDSDEQLLEGANALKYLRPNIFNGYALQQHHISVDPPGAIKRDIPVRLFRNGIGMKFYGLVHEHAELGINKGVGPDCAILGDFHIHHDGYLTESIRRGRFHRNLRLLECDRLKYPERLLGIYLYEIRDNIHLARYALEKNGGVMTPEVAAHCHTVIANFQKHFLAKEVMLAEDGMDYYSTALAMLGLGIEVAINIDVKKQGASLNGGAKVFRVLNAEEAKLIATRKIESLAAPLEGPYVA
jgi:glycosyltransferase involved in cell wall biosynthesis/SAM-dependent methyltransferase